MGNSMACEPASGFHGLVGKYKPVENLTVVLSAKYFSGSQGLRSHALASQHGVLVSVWPGSGSLSSLVSCCTCLAVFTRVPLFALFHVASLLMLLY